MEKEKKSAAEDTQKATGKVKVKIDEIISGSQTTAGSTPSGARIKRQNTPTTQNPPKTPASCGEFNNLVKDMNTEIAKQTTAGLRRAITIGNVLAGVDASTITCDADAIKMLETTKAEVVKSETTVTLVISVSQNTIAAAVEQINIAVATINLVNEELKKQSKTVIAGTFTTLQPVSKVSLPATDGVVKPTDGIGSTAGGAGQSTGGAGQSTGGAGPSTGGAGQSTGGAGISTGGAGPSTGGTAPSAGGSGPSTGGSGPSTNGAGTSTGGNGPTDTVSSGPTVSTGGPGGRLHFDKRSRGSLF